MHGATDEVLARADNYGIGKAAFEKARFVYPKEHLEMRALVRRGRWLLRDEEHQCFLVHQHAPHAPVRNLCSRCPADPIAPDVYAWFKSCGAHAGVRDTPPVESATPI